MTKTKTFDWNKPVAYDETAKAAFHREAKKALKALAKELGWAPETYDLRSNKGGIAVSGEITLHSDKLYIQVSQCGLGILVRLCNGRKDYSGGQNNWFPLSSLDNPHSFAMTLYCWEPFPAFPMQFQAPRSWSKLHEEC